MKNIDKILIPLLLGMNIFWAGSARAQEIELDSLSALPFGQNKSHTLSTAYVRSFSGDDINKYPTTDFRNMLTGLIPGLEVTETSGNPDIPAEANGNISLWSRGQSLRMVIDDVPVTVTQVQLDPEEIESITLLNDVVSKAKFGPYAANGILYIRTKRGNESQKSIKLNVEQGVGFVDRFPEWTNGTDYAVLNSLARSYSGYPVLFDEASIEGFAKNDPNDRLYPNVNFRKTLLKETKPFTRASFGMNGGNAAVRYNIYVGYSGEGDIYKVGSSADYNRLNIRSSIDAKITPQFEASVSFFGGLNFRRTPRYSTSNTGSTGHMELLLSDLRGIPPVAFPLILGKFTEGGELSGDTGTIANLEGMTIYGVNKQYTRNPLAAATEQGGMTERVRSGMINASLKYDFEKWVKGLKSNLFINLNTLLMNRQGKKPDYIAYYWDRTEGIGAISGHKGTRASGKSSLGNATRQSFNFFECISYDRVFGKHDVDASATFYISNTTNNANANYEKQMNLILAASYSYDNRYAVQGAVNYAGSSRFRPGYRYAWFPSVGASWIASNEVFLKDVEWIDMLKIRGQFGILGNETFGDSYLHESNYVKTDGITYGPYGVNQWFGSSTNPSTATNLDRLANPYLTWEKRREYEVGLDAVFFDRRLSLNATYYHSYHYDAISNVASILPAAYGLNGTAFYQNYASTTYQGAEISIEFRDKIGDFSYSVGTNLMPFGGYYGKTVEVEEEERLKKAGKPLGYVLGYVYLGKFESEEQIASSPTQMLGTTPQVGDLMYKDLDGNNIIDSRDRETIANTSPKLRYAININLSWKWLDLSITATGRAGFDVGLTNAYFWNGWGDGNYSNFVKENLGGAYPRLAYEKITNNFQNSAFWYRDASWLKIQNVELGFNAPLKENNKMGLKGLRVYLRGANLLTISGIKDVDPESINSGVTTYPLFRTLSGGVKFTF